jgi:CubicO group peptidase (beta-lactamase class C family)
MAGLARPALPASLILLGALVVNGAAGAETIEQEIEQIRARHALPSLAVLALKDGQVVAEGAVGVRKLGASEPITVSDIWHLGSCTKSMTSTLAAILVQQDKLKWQTTVGEVFPEWRQAMPEAWRGVTLEQLLTHRAGAPGDAPADLWAAAAKRHGTPTEQRLAFVHGLITRAPEAPPGTKFIYSNQGYAIAGAMIERLTKRPWEDLMRDLLFQPLHMDSAGFGAPATSGQVDQPWGHRTEGKDLIPVPGGPGGDNPPAIGPAGTVHASLRDWARYARVHAQGEQTGWGILPAEAFVKLHTPAAGQDYAMGWGVASRDWAGGPALTHSGSNTMFFVDLWVAPKKDAVFISATNAAGDPAAKGCDEAVAALVQRVLSP